jgi:two-component system nitrate/nitrite response regulator NarL
MLRILVVEDHEQFRRLICTELQRRRDFQIIEAADGVEAIQKAEELQPDLILLDINLPGLPGFEVARQARKLAPGSRILFLSQESSPDIVRKALGLGVDGYVQKLSAGTDLLPAIDAALAGHRFVSRSVAFDDPADVPASRRHEILFCSDDEAIVDGFARHITGALIAGDAVIALVTESHRAQLLHAMRTPGVNIDGALERGTCRFFDADIAPDPAGFRGAINGVRAAATQAGKSRPRVAFCGERAGRLWAAGRTAEAVQLEQLCGELPEDVDILCLYPVPYTNDDRTLTHICAEHTAVSAS